MALAGRAIVCSFNDVVPEGRENFYEWHNREHTAERLGIPGFLRGRRFIARRGTPEFFILYEAADLAVLGGPDYLARLNDPTPWTKISSKNFRNSFRSVFQVELSTGTGMGGFALVLRLDEADGERLRKALTDEVLPPIEPLAGVTGVHLLRYDRAISSIETVERKGRGAPFTLVPSLIMVEAISEAVLEQVLQTHLSPERLGELGATGSVETGIYQMEFCRTG